MTMVIDNQSRQYGGMGYEHLYSNPMQTSPHFTDPWNNTHASANSSTSLYPTSLSSSNLGLTSMAKQKGSRPTAISMPYSSIPVSAPSMVAGSNYSTTGYGGSDLLSLSQDLPRTSYGTEQTYATASPSTSAYAPGSYSSLNYAQSIQQQQHQQQQDESRRLSSSSVPTSTYLEIPPDPQRPRPSSLIDFDRRNDTVSRTSQATFGDAMDASRGMLALSQTDLTPRNIYGPRASRGSTDSYGFPSTHSSTSSISSASNYPYYSASVSSVDSSVTDYSSTTSESYDPMPSRTLPRPSGLLGASLPPAPQSMMGQFSSKMSSNTQKKHKCKVCDKRFTRPSSLQTHMYSHTGEKRKSSTP